MGLNPQQISNTVSSISQIVNIGLSIGRMLGLFGSNNHGILETNKVIFVYTKLGPNQYKLLGKEDGIRAYLIYKEKKPLSNEEKHELQYFPEYKAWRFAKIFLGPQSNISDYDAYIWITDNQRGGYSNRMIKLDMDHQNNNYSGRNGPFVNESHDKGYFDIIDNNGNKYVEIEKEWDDMSGGFNNLYDIGNTDTSFVNDPAYLQSLLDSGAITQAQYDEMTQGVSAGQNTGTPQTTVPTSTGIIPPGHPQTNTLPANTGNDNSTGNDINTGSGSTTGNAGTIPAATTGAGNSSDNNNVLPWNNNIQTANFTTNTEPTQAGFTLWLKIIFAMIIAKRILKKNKTNAN